jgi:proliferating cell nuclear antigen
MFEARVQQASLFKKLIDAIRELVNEANFDVSATGMQLQAMDTSHVSLVALMIRGEGFDHFRCDRGLSLGLNLASMTKVLKCAQNDDIMTLKAADEPEELTFVFESEKADRISDFDIKLMDIDSDHLGIPDMKYSAVVSMPAGEFQRIMRDMVTIGDSVMIECTKEAVKFSSEGDIGKANVTVRQTTSVDNEDEATTITLEEPVKLKFAVRYLNLFTRATPLSTKVTLSMQPEKPLVVEYKVQEHGYIRYYLAPKIDE